MDIWNARLDRVAPLEGPQRSSEYSTWYWTYNCLHISHTGVMFGTLVSTYYYCLSKVLHLQFPIIYNFVYFYRRITCGQLQILSSCLQILGVLGQFHKKQVRYLNISPPSDFTDMLMINFSQLKASRKKPNRTSNKKMPGTSNKKILWTSSIKMILTRHKKR